jgi:hypothetical protein
MGAVGTGLGLCLSAHCLVLGGDLPLSPAELSAAEGAGLVRYRHGSFHARFHLRPLRFGRLAPAFNLGLVTHVGRAVYRPLGREPDAAPVRAGSSSQTNVAVRGGLELAYRLFLVVDVMVEAGVDRTIDRAQDMRTGTYLQPLWSPWGLVGLRLMP